jgi:sugar phosphate isomerase/epimerase
VEFGLTQDTRRPVDTAAMVDAARAAGFDALGMVSGRFDDDAQTLLEAGGLRCHELLGLQVNGDLRATTAMAERLARDAAAVDAAWVLTTFDVPLGEVADAVPRWAAMFEDVGAGLALEFSPLGPVATIGQALEVLDVARSARAGMVIDSWNFCFGPGPWEELERVPFERVAYVQFADALQPVGEVDMHEAMHRRALPGDGVLDLDRFVATLRDRGWDALVSMQVLSDELRRLSVEDSTRLIHDAGARYWR